MGLEQGNNIGDLVPTNPLATDRLTNLADHLRLLKQTIKNTFPNIDQPVVLEDGFDQVLYQLNGALIKMQHQADAIATLNNELSDHAHEMDNRTLGDIGAQAQLNSGFIFPYAGLVSEIPSNYLICDGDNGTPDMSNRFAMGLGTGIVGDTQGELQVYDEPVQFTQNGNIWRMDALDNPESPFGHIGSFQINNYGAQSQFTQMSFLVRTWVGNYDGLPNPTERTLPVPYYLTVQLHKDDDFAEVQLTRDRTWGSEHYPDGRIVWTIHGTDKPQELVSFLQRNGNTGIMLRIPQMAYTQDFHTVDKAFTHRHKLSDGRTEQIPHYSGNLFDTWLLDDRMQSDNETDHHVHKYRVNLLPPAFVITYLMRK